MPTVGEPAPDFVLPNQDGERVRLSDFHGRKVILFAFPKADTPGCNIQACGFRDEFPRATNANAVVLGISGDTQADLKAWQESRNLPYDLLSDTEHKVLEAWGARRKMLGMELPGTVRSHWVIDEDGILIDEQIGISPRNSVEEALARI